MRSVADKKKLIEKRNVGETEYMCWTCISNLDFIYYFIRIA